jgi:hypothetical protein
MKKISISLFAVLIIIFSGLTAFTTSLKSNFFPDRWEIFGVVPNSVDGNPFLPAAYDVYGSKITDDFADIATSETEAFIEGFFDVDAYISSYNYMPPNYNVVICSSNAECICVASVAYANGMPYDGVLMDFNYGDYSLEEGF